MALRLLDSLLHQEIIAVHLLLAIITVHIHQILVMLKEVMQKEVMQKEVTLLVPIILRKLVQPMAQLYLQRPHIHHHRQDSMSIHLQQDTTNIHLQQDTMNTHRKSKEEMRMALITMRM
jgi:hypothetical protein